MSVPVEPDFAIIKMGDGATPTEAFAIICGIQDLTVNLGAGMTDRYVRDCAKPGEVPSRKTKSTGKQMDVTASGFIDKVQLGTLNTTLGKVKNYKIEYYIDDGTDAGVLFGTYAAAFRLGSVNQSLPRDGEVGVEVTLASHGAWTWTAA